MFGTERTIRLLAGGAGAAALAVGVFGIAHAGAAGVCTDTYRSYSALAAASGQHLAQAAPGLLPVNDADFGVPTSQAEFDSRDGSLARAGAPYSEAVAGNVGLTGVNANDIPVFVKTQYPADQKEDKSSPTSNLHAESREDGSKATTDGGGPGSANASGGRVQTSSASGCNDAGAIEATADNTVDLVDVAGVLRIGAVHSHAKATVDASGKHTLDGTMDVEGATVLGQPVAITDKGLVIGNSPSPLPTADPLTKALVDAGITVHPIAVVKNPDQGEVFAPGLEIVVTRGVQGVGTGPAVTTLVLGRAYARATQGGASDAGASAVADIAPPSDRSSPAALGSGTGGGSTPLTPSPSPAPAIGGTRARPVAVRPASAVLGRMASWSIARAYTALGVGLLLVTLSLLGTGTLGDVRVPGLPRRLARSRR
jgi:hypothetical protein